jgi:hypothetical protein
MSSTHHRGNRPVRSGQTFVYLVCPTKQEALQCVLFVHDHATRILGVGSDGMSPVVHVSCAATLRDILAGSGTARGIFAHDANAKNQSVANAYLPGICITLKRGHYYTNVAGAQHMEPVAVIPLA